MNIHPYSECAKTEWFNESSALAWIGENARYPTSTFSGVKCKRHETHGRDRRRTIFQKYENHKPAYLYTHVHTYNIHKRTDHSKTLIDMYVCTYVCRLVAEYTNTNGDQLLVVSDSDLLRIGRLPIVPYGASVRARTDVPVRFWPV